MSQVAAGNNPLYVELADKLRRDIESGVYGIGDRMPSEPTLCETTGHSRSTVRKALQLLVDQGYVTKSQGKGTFVSDIPKRMESVRALTATFRSFTQNARSHGATTDTQTIDIRTIQPTPGLAEFFGTRGSDEVFEATRLRFVDGDPACLETIWLPMAYSDLSGDELSGSLYEVLKERYGVEPLNGTKEIGICYATAREAFQLDVPKDTALMLIEDHLYDQHGRPLHVSKQVLRGDRHSYCMTIPQVVV